MAADTTCAAPHRDRITVMKNSVKFGETKTHYDRKGFNLCPRQHALVIRPDGALLIHRDGTEFAMTREDLDALRLVLGSLHHTARS